MRPTFLGFETAKTAIFTNQKSIDIMGNNLSNVDTNGYTRQRVERSSVAPLPSGRSMSNRVALAGQGVEISSISQIRDSFLDTRFRAEYAKASYHSQASSILQDIQTALGDGSDITDESGLYGAIQQIYEAVNDYVQDPTLDTEANIVMSAFKNITQVLQQMDSRLTQVADQHTIDLGTSVGCVNDIAAEIAQLNKAIGDDASVLTSGNSVYQPNELLDRRNLLLDELSSYGNISISTLANGKVNVSLGEHSIVEENTSFGLNLVKNNDNTVAIQWLSTGENLSTTEGALIGSMHYINGRGRNMQSSTESPYQGVLYYKDQINTFANALAKVANNTIPELDTTTGKPKVDADGNTVYKTLLSAKDSAGKTGVITAGKISLSKEWTSGGPGYFIYNRNEDVEDYAQQLVTQLTDKSYVFDSYGEKFTGSFVNFEVNFLGSLGSDLAFQQGRQDATAKISDDYLDRRDEISGVSKDEETTDMLKYQKSYQAASRLMTVLDDLLEVIINRMGRAGL